MLFEAKQISKSFVIEGGIFRRRVGAVEALRNVSVQLDPGETVALVGGSGCGKSTLARIITGLTSADSGALLWNDHPLEELTRVERSRCIQMIFQDPFASLNPKLSVGAQLLEVVRRSQDIERPHRRCVELLESVGLSEADLANYPFQFSGGQRQRIAIARALALGPQLLIADESLSALDVSIQAQILDLFRRLRREGHLTFLFITHDLTVANAFSDRIIVLKEGRIVEEGSAVAVFRNPQDAYTRALLAAMPQIPS